METKLFALDAEEFVLAYMVYGNGVAATRYCQTLRPEHFHDAFHREYFRRLVSAIRETPDCWSPTAIVKDLIPKFSKTSNDLTERVASWNWLAAFANRLPCVRFYENELHKAYVARGVVGVGETLVGSQHRDKDPYELFTETTRAFEKATRLADSELPSISASAIAVLDSLQRGDDVQSFTTGVPCFDEPKALYRGANAVVSARPGKGKSALCLQACVSAAMRGLRVAYFALEMPSRKLIERAMMAQLKLRKTQVWNSRDELSSLLSSLENHLFVFDNSHKYKTFDLEMRSEQVKQQHGLDIVVVDHMGLVVPGPGSRYEQVSNISTEIRLMAGQLEVAVINVCQLNRSSDGAPKLHNLRDSGRIEEDATSVMFIHSQDEDDSNDEVQAAVYYGKNRDGELRKFRAVFNKPIQRFMFDEELMAREQRVDAFDDFNSDF